MRKQLPRDAPTWVKIGLFGSSTRAAALGYAFGILVLAGLLFATPLIAPVRTRLEGWNLGVPQILALAMVCCVGGIHYLLSVRWADHHQAWVADDENHPPLPPPG